MLAIRAAQVGLFVSLVVAVTLLWPGEARAYHTWTVVTVESGADTGDFSYIAVDPNGDPMVSYLDWPSGDLKFAWCDMSATDCDAPADWTTKVIVDSDGNMGHYTSIAVDPNGDPMISYQDATSYNLKFARCDMSATGGCDETSDWTPNIVTVDSADLVGYYTSIAVDGDGNPMISYTESGDPTSYLKFAWCDMSATGNCDEPADWTSVVRAHPGTIVSHTSIAADANGDPMISYYRNDELKFITCDMSATGNCNESADWTGKSVTVDTAGDVGAYSSIAVDANGDPMISYEDTDNWDVKFARCDMSATGGCDETSDWTPNITTVESTVIAGGPTSIAVNARGDPLVGYGRQPPSADPEVVFAKCDLSGTGCDQEVDWWLRSVVATLPSGPAGWGSIAAKSNGDPIISYDGTLEVATPVECNTRLVADAGAGSGQITVDDPTGCEGQDYIAINRGESTGECHRISDWAENTLYLWDTLVYDHYGTEETGEPVIQVATCLEGSPYPPAGVDHMYVELTFESIDLDRIPHDCVLETHVDGPIKFTGDGMFARSDPYLSEGKWTVDTEILSMNLVGRVLGYQVNLRAGDQSGPPLLAESIGKIQEQTADSGGFPADSFFDVSFEVTTEDPALNVMRNCNEVAVRFEGVTNAIPAENVEYTVDGDLINACEEGTCPGIGPLAAWAWSGGSGSDPGGSGSGSLLVGGIAEWPDTAAGPESSMGSPSDSAFNYTALGGALAAAAAALALATGTWLFVRRRWLT
jgi:hypothetical protein